ncbi:hypothetical protein Vadar_034197 [Vaccinium darrowii]|uniref:Uncharacterized protein n=1 Tax=Vaccinium darrowii TaxID=229202 RepID=A0ACB7XX12_9ERIC|nr:hypothetical protein Vadar_034197 [Vaccinium darrowii]
MAVNGGGDSGTDTSYDRLQELKGFDQSKTGVKGLVDAGIKNIPKIFVRPMDDFAADYPIAQTHFTIPVIDLQSLGSVTVEGVRRASEALGFFQVVNHGVPERVLEEMLTAARGFHEMENEVKVGFYTREVEGRVKFGSNFDLYQSRFANWRDTLFCAMGPEPLDPLELPESIELLFSDSGQFLDFDYRIGIHNSGSDSIVPVQPMKSAQPAAKQMVDLSRDNYIETDFTNSKFNSFNSSAAPAGGTQEGEVDVGGGGSGDDEVSVVEVVVENSGNEREEAGGVSGGDS